MTTTYAPTVCLVNAVGGLLAEVTDLPMQEGAIWTRNNKLRELACHALHEAYPDLVVTGYSVCTETCVILFLERL